MAKKIFSVSLGILLATSSIFTGLAVAVRNYQDPVEVFFQDSDNPFPDVSTKTLAGKSALELFERGVIKGYPDGTFKGSQEVNRAEAAKFLLEARNQAYAIQLPSNRFPDVITSEWYAQFVLTAAELGIINGYPDGTFKPTNTIITAEFLKMLSLTFGLETNLPYTYEDSADFEGGWFWQYAGAAQKYELFPHRPSKLRPDVAITRSEMAVAIYQYLKNGPTPRPVLPGSGSPSQPSSAPVAQIPENTETSDNSDTSGPIITPLPTEAPEPETTPSPENEDAEVTQTPASGGSGFEPKTYPDAPAKIQIEDGYIAKQDDSPIEGLGLDFNFKSPQVRSILQDFDVRADTTRLDQFLLTVQHVPLTNSSITVGSCVISFQNGSSDNNCGDNTASIDIGVNNSRPLVASALAGISGISPYTIEIAQSGSVAVRFTRQNTPIEGNLTFADATAGSISRQIIAPGKTQAGNPLNQIIERAEFRVDGKIVGQAVTITSDRILFRDLEYEMYQSVNYRFQVIIFPKEVTSSGAKKGQVVRLFLPADAFTTAQNGSVQGYAGQEFDPGTAAETGIQLIISRAIPFFEAGTSTGTGLSGGTLELLNFRFAQVGSGSVEAGSGVTGSQFQVRLNKSSNLALSQCEIRDQQNSTVAIANADPSQGGTFFQDPYGLPFADLNAVTASPIAYVTFSPETFQSSKRLDGSSSNYSIYCNISSAPSKSSLQAEISSETQQFFIDNGDNTSPITSVNKIKKLPLSGTSRVSN